MKQKQLLLSLLFLIGFVVQAQTKKDYIYEYASVAVQEMEYAKIPASITLAQGILESRFGLSELSAKSNNHFGIKCHSGWEGGRAYHDDDAKGECFRVYKNAHESFRDHSDFLSKRGRYSDLFQLSIYDYKSWAKGLRKAGYATNPKYADHLIKIIEDEKLYVFDRMTSTEVGPYIASLQNNKQEGEVLWAKADKQPVRVNKPEPVNTSTQKDETIEIIGGPAASPEDEVAQSRDIFIVNDIKTIRSFEGDSKQQLASHYKIPYKRLERYNEWDKYGNEFLPGMKVYLQPKRSKNRDVTQLTHTVQPGETMYQIAQQYGIKTDKLYERNLLNEEKKEQPHPGQVIELRKNRDSKPKLLDPSKVFTERNIRVIDDGEGEAIGRPDQSDKEVDEFIQKEIIGDKPQSNQKPVTQPKDSPVITQQPSVIVQPTPKPVQQPKPVVQQESEPVILNPNRTVVKQQEQTAGRAIFYDPTPQVNRQPVKIGHSTTKPTNIYSQPSQPNRSTPAATIQYHKVVKGDTLYGLASKYNVSVSQIKAWNNLSGSTIKLGKRLIIKK